MKAGKRSAVTKSFSSPGDKDFRKAYASQVESWENEIDDLNWICEDWDYEQSPVPYKEKFLKRYKEIENYLKNTVKPFLCKLSEGPYKTSLSGIYKDLSEQAKENKAAFLGEEYPRMVADYKKYLAEMREEEKEYAAATKAVLKHLKACYPIRQRDFVAKYEYPTDVEEIIKEQIEKGVIERAKQKGAYVIFLAEKKK